MVVRIVRHVPFRLAHQHRPVALTAADRADQPLVAHTSQRPPLVVVFGHGGHGIRLAGRYGTAAVGAAFSALTHDLILLCCPRIRSSLVPGGYSARLAKAVWGRGGALGLHRWGRGNAPALA